MRRTLAPALGAAWLALLTLGCSTQQVVAPPVATPSVTLSRTDAAIGSPIDVTYAFTVAADAPAFADDYVVFVHFLSASRELLWTDDHQPGDTNAAVDAWRHDPLHPNHLLCRGWHPPAP